MTAPKVLLPLDADPGEAYISTAKQRILDRVQVVDAGHSSDCWISGRAENGKGYTKTAYMGRIWYTHRLAYHLFVGSIPSGLTIDHLCRNRACCNPAHLEAVSMRINTLRGTAPAAVHAAKTHCDRGHQFTPENTYLRRGRHGIQRSCKTCVNDRRRALR